LLAAYIYEVCLREEVHAVLITHRHTSLYLVTTLSIPKEDCELAKPIGFGLGRGSIQAGSRRGDHQQGQETWLAREPLLCPVRNHQL
jgi:hypothetical protein